MLTKFDISTHSAYAYSKRPDFWHTEVNPLIIISRRRSTRMATSARYQRGDLQQTQRQELLQQQTNETSTMSSTDGILASRDTYRRSAAVHAFKRSRLEAAFHRCARIGAAVEQQRDDGFVLGQREGVREARGDV